MLIGVPVETAAGETRVAATPDAVKNLVAPGHDVPVQGGAGLAAARPDAAYEPAGAQMRDAAGALGCDVALKVRSTRWRNWRQGSPGKA